MNAEEAVMVDTPWEQAGAFIATSWAIWGMVLLGWKSGVKFWTWRRTSSSRQR